MRRRQQRPTWGARKIRGCWRARYGRRGCPAVAPISRWLKRGGLAAGRRRVKAGPRVIRPGWPRAWSRNDVWTVDFKGGFRTGEGPRVDPLTVRDRYRRYGLRGALLRGQTVKQTQRAFVKIFQPYGLPQRMRSDHGVPFGGGGPTGLTRRSAGWIQRGIGVKFTTPGRPCEQGAPEPFHRVYQAEAASNPARTRAGQPRRSHRWWRPYNPERPHEALRRSVPAAFYRKSKRRRPASIQPWKYPAPWVRRWVKANGQIHGRGARRLVGAAFGCDYVGMKPVRKGRWKVDYGPWLVGELQ
jgi:hypothetical protein